MRMSECHQPAATSATLAPAGTAAATGVRELSNLPVPSWPKAPQPHAKALPLAVSSRVWREPAATLATFSPAREGASRSLGCTKGGEGAGRE